ncbi:MAG TPA: radical SAM protein [Polyangiaceae bacterium]|nr:radical SAM protein [Polyangiaceae bacterium]
MIVRYEAWGAWVRLESTAAIVAIDRAGVRALGLDGGDAWAERGDDARPSAPLEVHLAVTGRCGAGCRGCYLDARPDGLEPSYEALCEALDAMRDAGVFTVAFGGGEPTMREDLAALALAARERGLTPVLTTSGLGLSPARVERLRAFAQVNVSYDGASATYAGVRGFDGAAAAESAVRALASEGIRVGVNVVLTRASYPRLAETLARARSLGAREAQLLRYKPAGRAASLDYYAQRLSQAQARSLGPTLRRLVQDLAVNDEGLAATAAGAPAFGLRIDCALVPFLSADAALAANPAVLARFGVFGCEAAGALAAVDARGQVSPCSFAPPTSLAAPALADGYASDPELARWRAYAARPPEPCAACSLAPVCKGGCKVVASFVGGAFGPDPECPRVVDYGSDAKEHPTNTGSGSSVTPNRARTPV